MNSAQILSWNIRGINNGTSVRNLKDIVTSYNVGIVCLQETKSEDVINNRLGYLSRLSSFKCLCQPSRGLSGGLLTGWDSNLFSCVAVAQDTSWIWSTFRHIQCGYTFHVINIYSPLDLDRKRQLWKDMRSIQECVGEEAVCFVGDFNCVRAEVEKFRCIYNKADT